MINYQGFRPLFSEINPLFMSNKDTPNIIRISIRMNTDVDEAALRHAVDLVSHRYPYFCVELKKQGGHWGFVDNSRPVTVQHLREGIELNSVSSNYHLMTFSWYEDWIVMDVSHALTDATGAIEAVRTLLYYYCSRCYGVSLGNEHIRLAGDIISSEEWDDPAMHIAHDLRDDDGKEQQPIPNIVYAAGAEQDTAKTVFSLSIGEEEFMRFSSEHNSGPGTIAALLLSRAIMSLHTDSQCQTLINLCLNLRKALGTPLAHQCLVGNIWLEYNEKMRKYPLSIQAAIYRGMVIDQMQAERALTVMKYINRNTRSMLAIPSDKERAIAGKKTCEELKHKRTATVSYAGKGNLGDAERYIRDFHLWACAMNEDLLVEISAVGSRFTLDFIQNFSSPRYVQAFIHQLEEIGIPYEQQTAVPLSLPGIVLPWEE